MISVDDYQKRAMSQEADQEELANWYGSAESKALDSRMRREVWPTTQERLTGP